MAETSSELFKWLRGQETLGRLESRGEFTLDPSKAWESLGAFQLPFAEAWILKLVQAVMAHPSALLTVNQSRTETLFRVVGSDWSRDAVEKAIFEMDTTCTRDLSHLAVAIRALAQLKSRPFSLQYSDRVHLAWDGEKFAPLPAEFTGTDGPCFQLTVANFKFGESRSVFSLDNLDAANFRAQVASVLATHCHMTRQRIEVDGLSVTGYLNDPEFGFTEKSRPVMFLKAPPVPGMPTLHIVETEGWKEADLGQLSVVVDAEAKQSLSFDGPCSVAGIVSVFVKKKTLRDHVHYYDSSRGNSEVLWVQDGVVVERERLKVKGAVGLGVLVSAQGLDTDLTGLTPRDGEAKDARRNQAIKAIYQTLLKFQEELGDEGFEVVHQHLKSYLIGAVGVVCMVFVPVIGLAVLSKAGYDYTSAERRGSYLDSAFDAGLAKLVRDFARLADGVLV